MEKSTIDIVERLQKWDIGLHDEAADYIKQLEKGNMLHLELAEIKEAEIKELREDLDLIKKMARAEIDAKLRYAAALRKIADIEHEDLAAPKSAAEAVLWVCLDRCVTLAENALKWNE